MVIIEPFCTYIRMYKSTYVVKYIVIKICLLRVIVPDYLFH